MRTKQNELASQAKPPGRSQEDNLYDTTFLLVWEHTGSQRDQPRGVCLGGHWEGCRGGSILLGEVRQAQSRTMTQHWKDLPKFMKAGTALRDACMQVNWVSKAWRYFHCANTQIHTLLRYFQNSTQLKYLFLKYSRRRCWHLACILLALCSPPLSALWQLCVPEHCDISLCLYGHLLHPLSNNGKISHHLFSTLMCTYIVQTGTKLRHFLLPALLLEHQLLHVCPPHMPMSFAVRLQPTRVLIYHRASYSTLPILYLGI